jgi:hypothetical protein
MYYQNSFFTKFIYTFLFLSFCTLTTQANNFKKVRLDYQSPIQTESQILLGFMNQFATEGIDPGYDTPDPNNHPFQFQFTCQNQNLVIQGVGYFNQTNSYPLRIVNAVDGIIKIKVNSTENFENNQSFYILDSQTNIYYNITTTEMALFLTQGTYTNRFYMVFTNQAILPVDSFINPNDILVYQTNAGLNIDLSAVQYNQVIVKVFSLEGKVIFEKELIPFTNNVLHVNVSQYYVLQFRINNQTYYKKIFYQNLE